MLSQVVIALFIENVFVLHILLQLLDVELHYAAGALPEHMAIAMGIYNSEK